MPRTFEHLFVVINMPTQISHTCFRTGKIFLVKEEQGIAFSTTKITLMWTPHSNNVKHANVIKPGNRLEEGKRTRCQRVDQSLSECGIWAIYVFQINIILFNNLNLTTLASINQNLPKYLYCISKQFISSPLLLKKLSACDMYVLQILDASIFFQKKVPSPENKWNL